MAKSRRVIRRVKPAGVAAFDEQFWPVILAVFVLGGFLMGTVLAYLDFGDPRWYANAWGWVFTIPIVLCILIALLRKVESRAIQRSVQFSSVLCIIVHLILLVIFAETNIFARFFEDSSQVAELRDREQLIEPEYQQIQLEPEQRPQQEINRPVETETPDPTIEELPREQVEEEPVAEPEPRPTPETVPTVEPNAVTRPTPAKTTPRQSEQTSQLSRQMTDAQPRPAEPVPTPQMNQQSEPQTSAVTATETAVTRQPAQLRANRRVVDPTQATTNQRNETQMTRRVAEVSPRTEATPSPTMRRTQTPPTNVPRTAVNATSTPSVSRQTRPSEIRPNTIATRQQPTASPSTNRTVREPTTQPQVDIQRAQQRQNPSENQPTLAQTPRSVANPRPRVTTRPDVSTTAAAAGATSQPDSRPVTVEAQTTPVERTTTETAVARRATQAPTTSQPTQVATTQQRATRNSQQPSPSSQPAAASIARAAPASALPSPTTQAQQITGAVRQTQSSEVSPTSVATRLQATASPQAARATAEPSPAVTRSPDSAIANAGTRRRAQTVPAPQVVQATSSALQRQSRSGAQPTASVAAVAAPTSNAANSTAAGSPSASATSVARQSASNPAADTSRPAGAVAATATGSQAAATRALRRSTNQAPPTMNSQVAGQTGSPSRSTASRAPSANVTAANAATQPTSEGSGQPSPEATRMAITRSLGGTAGVGQSANMDRSLAANSSPSLVASGSARRAQATQNSPEGAALSPMAPALARSAVAGTNRPQASLLATEHVATSRGSDSPTEVNASASSALARADSNASPAAVTAAAGNIDVDTGPTRVVDEGGVSRASGGGQPELNQESASQQVARSRSGASAAPALAGNISAEMPSPTAGTDGGQPAAQEVEPTVTLASRGADGGAAPAAGSPTATGAEVAAGTSQADDLVSAPSVARAGGATLEGSEQIAAMAGGEEDEEEKARRLARSAIGGAPQLAVSAPVVAPQVGAPAGQPGSAGQPGAGSVPAAAPAAGSVTRSGPSAAPATSMAATAVAAAESGGGSGGATIGQATMQRAEATSATLGEATPGGGTSSPARAAPSRAFAANVPAVEVTVDGVSQSGGSPDGTPIEAQATTTSRSVGGVVARANLGPVGAVDGAVAVAGTTTGPDTTLGSRQRAPSSQAGPAMGDAALAAAPLNRSQVGGMTAGPLTAAAAAVPEIPSSVARDHGITDVLAMASNIQPMSRQSAGGLPVHLGEIEGPGGLGAEPSIDVGVNTRQARRDSTNVQPEGPRFSRSDFGGVPSLSTKAVVAAKSFRGRAARMNDADGGAPSGGFGPQTEEAIERGLAFLTRQQLADGSWSLQSLDRNVALVSDTAATGLAMLAFQGAGYNHREFKYADVVAAGLGFLVENQRADGDLFVPLDDRSNASVWLYSHGIAAIALCEAYGMTQDPELLEPAQKAIDFIVASQHKQRGGWRYAPGSESDTSVSGWMMMALKSGRLAGLKVPDETFVRLDTFLKTAQGQDEDDQSHMFRYNPHAPDTNEQRHGRSTSKTMTAVGLLMRLYSGWSRDHPQMKKGADYLRENLPEIGTTRDPKRDTYYWYYATQVMFHVGGDYWRDWNNRLHSLLVDSQIEDGPMAGSWDPRAPIPDTWAPHAGRLYVTTLNLLSLEVTYRHLPLFEDTAR